MSIFSRKMTRLRVNRGSTRQTQFYPNTARKKIEDNQRNAVDSIRTSPTIADVHHFLTLFGSLSITSI